MRIQPAHILLLVLVIILVFGANRLPDLARSVGQSLKIFKKEIKELGDDDKPSSTSSSSTSSSASATPRDERDGSTTTTRSSAEQPPQG